MRGIRAGGNTGSKMYFYCGCIFSVIGVIFVITFLLVMSHWETVAANGQGEMWLIPVAFGLMSVIMLVIGFLLLRLYSNEQKKIRRLLGLGEYVIADITGFSINYHNRVNGILTYFVECTYQDPTTETVHVFRSRDIGIAFLPEKITAKTVRVYVDRSSGYQDYYVDVDSILPHVVRH
jgi:hypothetical protein